MGGGNRERELPSAGLLPKCLQWHLAGAEMGADNSIQFSPVGDRNSNVGVSADFVTGRLSTCPLLLDLSPQGNILNDKLLLQVFPHAKEENIVYMLCTS